MPGIEDLWNWMITCGGGVDSESKYAHWPAFEAKCKKEGLNKAAIAAFKYNYEMLASGANLMMPEASISPVASLPSYDSLTKEDPTLLKQTVMLKLNGGLGTGMGLEKAKSLLTLKGSDTFLDFIAKQGVPPVDRTQYIPWQTPLLMLRRPLPLEQ